MSTRPRAAWPFFVAIFLYLGLVVLMIALSDDPDPGTVPARCERYVQ